MELNFNAKEDLSYPVIPHANHYYRDTDEFVNGIEDRMCIECGNLFVGRLDSFLCFKCLIAISKLNIE